MIFPPHGRAFWMPLVNALVAFGLGYVLGLRGDPVFVGAVCAGLVWLYDHARWLGIVASCYAPAPAPVATAPEPGEEGAYPLGVQCRQNEGTLHRIDETCPLAWSDLQHFAIEIRNGRTLAYRDWVGKEEDKWSTNEGYREFLAWMISRGWATGGQGETARMSAYGMCIFNDIVEGSFHTSPLPNSEQSR